MARETENMQFEHANAMPAATWHFLKMNDTTVKVPAGLALAPRVRADAATAQAANDAFDQALAGAQEVWEAAHPAPTAEERTARDAFLAAEADATYGGTAQSAYQAGAAALEEARSLSLAFETGVGEEAAAYLRYAAGERMVVQAGPGESVDAQVVVSSAKGAFSAAAPRAWRRLVAREAFASKKAICPTRSGSSSPVKSRASSSEFRKTRLRRVISWSFSNKAVSTEPEKIS